MAKAIVDAWLDAEYIGSGRHERRVNMIEEEAAGGRGGGGGGGRG